MKPAKPLESPVRSEDRRRITRMGEAAIELDDPHRQRVRFDVLNMSATGVCSGPDDGDWSPDPGYMTEHAVLWLGDMVIVGRLTVMHATGSFSSGTLCGAEFHPATESDRRRLADFITRFPILK